MTSFVSYRLKNETRWSACFYAYLCAGKRHLPTPPSLPTYSLPNWILSWKKFITLSKIFLWKLVVLSTAPLPLNTLPYTLSSVVFNLYSNDRGDGWFALMWYIFNLCSNDRGEGWFAPNVVYIQFVQQWRGWWVIWRSLGSSFFSPRGSSNARTTTWKNSATDE